MQFSGLAPPPACPMKHILDVVDGMAQAAEQHTLHIKPSSAQPAKSMTRSGIYYGIMTPPHKYGSSQQDGRH